MTEEEVVFDDPYQGPVLRYNPNEIEVVYETDEPDSDWHVIMWRRV